jgi:ABC-type nitrate/sulfonate/bicarbonate transport system ATPase subunit
MSIGLARQSFAQRPEAFSTDITTKNAAAGRGSLQLRHVDKSYEVDGRQLEVLKGIDLVVEPGEFVSLVGASGCGKSTILRLIVGLDVEHGGDIFLDGRPVTGPRLNRGIVFQEHRLLPWLTIEENVGLSLAATNRPAAECGRLVRDHINLVGLQGFERAYPHQLSGGMAQRAAIARGLVNQPEILLLDEPFGALDALTRAHLQNELLQIWSRERITMVMVTHDVEEAVFLSDKIVVLAQRPGRIRRIIDIDLPHPRDHGDPRFIALRRQALDELSQ